MKDKEHVAITPAKREFAVMRPIANFPALWQDFDELFDSIEKRAYELFEGRGRQAGRDLEDWFRAEREFLQPLTMEVTEKDNNFIIRADVPGFEAKDLDVTLDADCVTISGKKESAVNKKENKEKTLYTERNTQQTYRTLMLPAGVLPEKATASLKDGVLEITAPKAVPAKKVEVKAA